MSKILRVELTTLDPKLFRSDLKFFKEPVPHFLYCTPYEDAVSPPFPVDGKSGLSVLLGRREQFRKVEVPLLWDLEKKRGRARMAVLTNLRGREFIPAFYDLESSLSEPRLAPISFLRRRNQTWDSLDFFSSGGSESMQGAAARLKRLKQRGWELVVDRLALADPAVKQLYFETLHVDRGILQDSLLKCLGEAQITTLVGIAGQCLQREHLPLFFREEMNARVLKTLFQATTPTPDNEHWTFLAKRDSAKELLLLGKGERGLSEGEILIGESSGESRESELAIGKILQRLEAKLDETVYTAMRVRVDWRYRPARQIPTIWKQISTLPAGSRVLHG